MNIKFHIFIPLIIIIITILMNIFNINNCSKYFQNSIITIIGLCLTFLSFFYIYKVNLLPILFMNLLLFDKYILLYILIILFISIVCSNLAYVYLKKIDNHREEFYILLISSTLGAIITISSIHSISLILGIEIMSISIYGMISYNSNDLISLESGIKYMILSSIASSFLLLGIAILYAYSGTLSFFKLSLFLIYKNKLNYYILLSIIMIFIGIAFKLSIVPWHMWTADIYEGAPIPVAAFIATINKIVFLYLLLRFFLILPNLNIYFFKIISIFSILSIIIGNILALYQNNLKRLLGYSSIANMGYLFSIIRVLQLSYNNYYLIIIPINIYLFIYLLNTLGIFCILTILSSTSYNNYDGDLSIYSAMFNKRPIITLILTYFLISQLGFPLTAGFLCKFYLYYLIINAKLSVLIIINLIGNIFSIYYYIRIIRLLYLNKINLIEKNIKFNLGIIIIITFIILILLLIGFYPMFFLKLINSAKLLNFIKLY